ncbi:MAG: hypothetical protein QOC66_2517 [Pseudonocardiales bacterium]|nr:hypothetical protein [Pseudonocardiales bacterium]
MARDATDAASENRRSDAEAATTIDPMTATRTTTFSYEPLPADILAEVRASDRDASGNPVQHVVATGGEPLRCCLRDASAGEAAILFGYEPPLPASPYRSMGAVFAHAEPCAGPEHTDTYPADWRGRPQALRAYDARGWIHPATTTHDGTDPDTAITAILADPDVVQLHSHNLAYGCYMFAVARSIP